MSKKIKRIIYKKISVLIIFRNEKHGLEKTVMSVLNCEYPSEKLEIVCVNDGSTDGSEKIVEEYPVVLINKPPTGISDSRNVGIEKCSGEYLLFLDGHLYLKNSNSLKLINSFFQKKTKMAGLFGKYLTTQKMDYNFVRDIRREALFNKRHEGRVITLKDFTSLSGGLCAFRRKLLLDNKFPSYFENSYGEDTYLQIQLLNKGYYFFYVPKISGEHDAHLKLKDLIRKMFYEIRSSGNILLASSKTKDQIVPFQKYFLSYPLLTIIFLFISIWVSKIFFYVFIAAFLIDITPILKILFMSKFNLVQRLTALVYVILKEFLQTIYLPFYLGYALFRDTRIYRIFKILILWEYNKYYKVLNFLSTSS